MEKSQNNQKKGGKCLKTVTDKLFHGSLQTLHALNTAWMKFDAPFIIFFIFAETFLNMKDFSFLLPTVS